MTVTKSAERNLPLRRPVRIGVYVMCFGLPPGFRFGLDFLGSAEQYRKFLVSPIGLFLTEPPNPNRRPSGSFPPFDPAELVRVSPQQSFSSIRGAKSDLRVCAECAHAKAVIRQISVQPGNQQLAHFP